MPESLTSRGAPPVPSCAALRTSILAARDERQARLDALFPAAFPATLMLSLNLPGELKGGERASRLYGWGEKLLIAALPVLPLLCGSDALGPYGIFHIALDAVDTKRMAMELESGHPAGRLLDLDVFDDAGRQVDRSSLGLAPRPCLLCPEPALACIRTQRHSSLALQAEAERVIDAL